MCAYRTYELDNTYRLNAVRDCRDVENVYVYAFSLRTDYSCVVCIDRRVLFRRRRLNLYASASVLDVLDSCC